MGKNQLSGMIGRMMKKIILATLSLICLFCSSCTGKQNLKPKILVTIPPYAGFVKTLTGGKVDVEIFVIPGSNPHTYEPSPEQIKHFTEAKVWFRTGDPVETKMIHFLAERNVKIVDLSENWAILEEPNHHHHHSHEEKDLHLWLNPQIVIEQVETMRTVLAEQFPQLAPTIDENSDRLKEKLRAVDAEIDRRLVPYRGAYLLVSHPALGYFCQRYGLYQLSVEIDGKDPLPQDVSRLISELKVHPVPVMLIEPQYNNKGAILIAHNLHIPYAEIDPYAEDYFGMLNHLTTTVVKYYGHTN